MKRKLSLSVLLMACLTANATFRINIPEAPRPHEKTAAEELRHYLNLCAADTLTVNRQGKPVFHVGDTPFARSQGFSTETMREEEWTVRSLGRDVILLGGGTRGTLYAVYHFLEEACHVRWWNQTEEYIPESKLESLPELKLHGCPAFKYRNIYRWPMPDDHGRFAARNRINHNGPNPITVDYGGAFNYGPPKHVHTFDAYVPESTYLKDHPDLFALVDGKRMGGNYRGQLCLSNPRLKDLFLKQLKKNIEGARRYAIFHNTSVPKLYDISQNDDAKPCSCKDCLRQIQQYGYSGQIILFVNQLAREIRKSHPHVILTTLAYGYSLKPPKGNLRTEPNVVVKLCRGYESNPIAPISHADNRNFADTIRAWQKHCDNIFIWDYSATYWDGTKGLPFPSELTYEEKHRFYHRNNVTGIFWEHEYPSRGDMYDLKVYLEAKLMENPYLNAQALIQDFMDKYYGPAGKHILAYRRLLQRAGIKNNGQMGGNIRMISFAFIDDQTIVQSQKLFENAEQAVSNDPIRLKRVRQARLGLDRLTCRKSLGRPLPHAGEKPDTITLPAKAAEARARALLAKAWMDYPPGGDRDYAKKENETELKQYRLKPIPHPPVPPKRFQGRTYFDLTPNFLEDHSHGFNRLVRDDESACGAAFEIDAHRAKGYELPWLFSFYNTAQAKTTQKRQIHKPMGQGYHWYHVATMKNLRNTFMLLDRNWTTQLHLPWDETLDRKWEIWVSMKFSGRNFFPQSASKSTVRIDRVLLVKP